MSMFLPSVILVTVICVKDPIESSFYDISELKEEFHSLSSRTVLQAEIYYDCAVS